MLSCASCTLRQGFFHFIGEIPNLYKSLSDVFFSGATDILVFMVIEPLFFMEVEECSNIKYMKKK